MALPASLPALGPSLDLDLRLGGNIDVLTDSATPNSTAWPTVAREGTGKHVREEGSFVADVLESKNLKPFEWRTGCGELR
jgi:hypothetical protein